jgi:hypothetical protein
VLATLAVILWAYGMYALFSFIFQRQGSYLKSRSRWRKLPWLTLLGGVGAGLGIIFWCCFPTDKTDQRLRLTGFLGTVYAEAWPGRVDNLNYPPVNNQSGGTGEQPVYSLLHPETPASQMAPEKKLPKPRPGRAVTKGHADHARHKASKTAKATKAPAPAKKGKSMARSRAKKKKRPAAARNRHASAG